VRPFIFVLAGVNGAGKSSVAGAMLQDQGLSWFNPDTYARQMANELGMDIEEANSRAWERGRSALEKAIAKRSSYAFETTLGGTSMTRLLAKASRTHSVVMLYCGLSSAELHIERVAQRVVQGGHDIPEAMIRERWDASRVNLVKLLPVLSRLQVLDNSARVETGQEIPDPVLVLEMESGQVIFPESLDAGALNRVPAWARPIMEAAIQLPRQGKKSRARRRVH
jgi:predicted ABC-type ATPase